MKRTLLLGLLCIPLLAQASSLGFRIVHPDGSVEFTDDPLRGGEPIELLPAPAVPAFRAPPSPSPVSPPPRHDNKEVEAYQSLSILSPEQDEVIWFDGTGLGVSVAIQPALQADHRVVIQLNGETVAEGQANSYVIPQIFRGSHRLQARILDVGGAVLKESPAVHFHFRQHSITRPQPSQP